jgi:hypothetical protein
MYGKNVHKLLQEIRKQYDPRRHGSSSDGLADPVIYQCECAVAKYVTFSSQGTGS